MLPQGSFGEFILQFLALALLIERLIEMAWSCVELYRPAPADKDKKAHYSQIKMLISTGVALILGVVFSLLAAPFGLNLGIGNSPGVCIAYGLLVGAIAPYSHEIINLLKKTQKLLDQKRDTLNSGPNDPNPAT